MFELDLNLTGPEPEYLAELRITIDTLRHYLDHCIPDGIFNRGEEVYYLMLLSRGTRILRRGSLQINVDRMAIERRRSRLRTMRGSAFHSISYLISRLEALEANGDVKCTWI